jgi:hypothetical protein
LQEFYTDRLARQLAALTGESLTEAVVTSLRERLGRQRVSKHRKAGTELARLAAELSKLPGSGHEAVAILSREADSDRCVRAMDEAEALQISAASVLEVAMVVESRHGDRARRRFDKWLETSSVEVMVLTRDQVEMARRVSAVLAKEGTRQH